MYSDYISKKQIELAKLMIDYRTHKLWHLPMWKWILIKIIIFLLKKKLAKLNKKFKSEKMKRPNYGSIRMGLE